MPAGKISEDTVTAIRSALEDGCYREVFRLVGIAWIDRKTLLNWLKRGEREKSGCTWLSSELSPESFRDEEFHLKNIKDASTGAGGVIIMHEDTLPEKRPYLLQADSEALVGLLDAMEKKAEMINRMAHLTPVRTFRKLIVSVVAIETEFQILNTLLSEKVAQLEVTENQLFRIFCRWDGVDYATAEVVVTYPKRFELRDRKVDLDFLDKALAVAARLGSPTLKRELERQVARVVLERDDVLETVEADLI